MKALIKPISPDVLAAELQDDFVMGQF